jgi:hypothetical protein
MSGQAERRRVRRKRVLLSGVVVDTSGENATGCTIRDMTANGAQIQLRKALQPGSEVYLVDTRNELAHLATVAWVNYARTGLSFIRSYALTQALPPRLEFLGPLLVGAKVRQVQDLIKRGIPVEEATCVVGLSEEHLDRISERGSADEKVALLLAQAKQLLEPLSEPAAIALG